MKYILSLFALSLAFSGMSQTITADSTGKDDSSAIVVHVDPRVDMLIKKQIQINELTSRDARRSAKGYRLLIISTNKQSEAIAAKTTIYTYFPELKAYLWHQSPYYKLKAGNFKERKDAEEYQQRLKAYFPKGVFIMNDVIEVKLDTDREDQM